MLNQPQMLQSFVMVRIPAGNRRILTVGREIVEFNVGQDSCIDKSIQTTSDTRSFTCIGEWCPHSFPDEFSPAPTISPTDEPSLYPTISSN